METTPADAATPADPSAAAPDLAPVARGEVVSTGVERTGDLGRTIGRAAAPGTLIALDGPLGAGKTQFAKGIAQGLEVQSVVNSPTFVLMNEHEGRLRLFHIDAYRLEGPEDAYAAGLLDDRQLGGVAVVEWADRVAALLPADRLEISIRSGAAADERILEWRAYGLAHAALADALEAARAGRAGG
ncbi:MAG: tRNA (adenosine(37)-N6)-threonylcarbamoyltransferase complex ATPase subunit type 1 TsaE [Candidatus Limnocylindria bacterium]